jgi:2-methylcitrate dehydratase PrpD
VTNPTPSVHGNRESRPVTRLLAQMACELSWSDLSEAGRQIAKQATLDWFGVAIAGAITPPTQALAKVLAWQGGTPAATAFFVGRRLPSMSASLFNGTASHALDYDDVHFAVPGHATAPALAAALAVAEEVGASGARLLEAFVAGYETSCRVGLLLAPTHYASGFHATATAGTFGATAAAGKLLNFDEDTMARAFGIAATRAGGLKAVFGTSGKPLQAGNAAQNGVFSALLAQTGVDAIDDVLEHRLGFGATHGTSWNVDAALGPPPLVRDLALAPAQAARAGAKHHVEHNLFKYHATCYETHSAIEGASAIRRTLSGAVQRLRSVTIEANPHCADICNITQPNNGSEAKFSIRLGVALAMLGLPTGDPALFSNELVKRSEVIAMRDKVSVVLTDEVGVPVARLHATLDDGNTLTVEHDSSQPAADLNFQQKQLENKFLGLAMPQLGRSHSIALLARLRELESCSDLNALTEALV